MYEYADKRAGMGWSDYLPEGRFVTCDHVPGGVKKCFLPTTADRRCAENSGCFELRNEGCSTTAGGSGNLWCCPRDLPPPQGSPCVAQSTAMVCRRHDTRCSDFYDDRSYAICRVQKALCDLGIDAGPIDGQGTSDMYPIALRMFQARNGLSTTGRVDSAVLERLGLSTDPRMPAASEDRPGAGVGLPPGTLSYFWPVAFSAASLFLTFSWWKWGRRRR